MAVNECTTTQTLLKKLELPNLVHEKRCDLEDCSDSASGPLLTPISGAMAGHKEISSGNAHESSTNQVRLEISDSESQSGVIISEDVESTVSSVQGEMCRICHCDAEDSEVLISPCSCSGSMKYVHQTCLQKWVKSRDTKKCELCSTSYNMTSSVKPFRQWKKLDMSSVERRKVLCSVTFHVVAITCVIWSLYVLIEKTTHEIKEGKLTWPFWTKLVVVAIGFTGGLVFMYVQCKMYVQLFKKWKQFNRVIYINDVQIESTDIAGSISPCQLSTPSGADGVIVIHMADAKT